jgi:ribosomal protein S18 acetylase RimI-like enzyme
VHVRPYAPEDREAVLGLVAAFRVEIASFRGRHRGPDLQAAADELQDYLDRGFPVWVADADPGRSVGYLVCRVDNDTVWAESLFVSLEYRRRHIAAMLYEAAECYARGRGQPTLYNWIHPNNDRIIRFLKGRGYDVLNLVEIRRPLPGETFQTDLRIGDHDYRY